MKIILSILLLLACGTALAATPPMQQPFPAQSAAPPPELQLTPADRLRIGVGSLMAFMNQEPIPAPSAVARYLDENIVPLFDFNAMARAAGGRYYLSLSPAKRAAMAEDIKELFLTRLTVGLAGYDGQKVRFLRPRFSPNGNEATVSMLILNPGRYPARIDFRLVPEGNDWRIVDMAANGTSAVVYYRQMLARQMARLAYQRRQAYPPPRGWQGNPFMR